jgi:hypothetical protein
MPRGDRSGPMGMGPRTGRGAGYCSGSGMPGFANPGYGRGFGGGIGFRGAGFSGGGRGRRNRFYATGRPGWMDFGGYPVAYQGAGPDVEKQALKNQAEALQSELDLIKKRLGDIEAGTVDTQ